jgi:hypothetical protein
LGVLPAQGLLNVRSISVSERLGSPMLIDPGLRCGHAQEPSHRAEYTSSRDLNAEASETIKDNCKRPSCQHGVAGSRITPAELHGSAECPLGCAAAQPVEMASFNRGYLLVL